MSSEDASTVAGAIVVVLDVVTVASRFYSRWFTKAGFGWDDWTILVAMVSGILPVALNIWAGDVSKTGPAAASNFDPSYVFTPADVKYVKITFSTIVLYFLVSCTTKLSLLLLLHRIFAISGPFKIQIYIAEATVVAFWISTTVAHCLSCIPIDWSWKNGNADPRYCINYNTFWLVSGIFESVIDVAILSLPLGMVSKLHMERSRKFSVAGVFLLGGFVLFSGVAKVVLSYVPHSREPNFARSALWTTVHLYTGILCANLPPNRPLFNRVAQSITGSWVRLSSLSKRWYSLDSDQHFTDVQTIPRSMPADNSRNDKQPADVEVGRTDYELTAYSRELNYQ